MRQIIRNIISADTFFSSCKRAMSPLMKLLSYWGDLTILFSFLGSVQGIFKEVFFPLRPEDILCVVVSLNIVVSKADSNSIKVTPEEKKWVLINFMWNIYKQQKKEMLERKIKSKHLYWRSTQWAAVAIHSSLINVPPQKWLRSIHIDTYSYFVSNHLSSA